MCVSASGIQNLFDPGPGMEKFGSGINIPDPQNCNLQILSKRSCLMSNSNWLTVLQVWSGGATVGTGASCVHGALPQRLYGLSPQIRREVRHVAASPLLDI